jgi:hypothetical protein
MNNLKRRKFMLFIAGLLVGAVVSFGLTVWFSKNNKNTLAKVRDAESKVVDKFSPNS